MQVKDLGEMARTIKAAIEGYYGLSARLGKIFYPEQPASKPMCKSMGVGLFAASVILDSPTGKPVASFKFTWGFTTRVRDVEEDEVEEFGNTQHWGWGSSMSHQGPLLPDARVVSVKVHPENKAWPPDNVCQPDAGKLSDLWPQIL
jgi:hypothetical protein